MLAGWQRLTHTPHSQNRKMRRITPSAPLLLLLFLLLCATSGESYSALVPATRSSGIGRRRGAGGGGEAGKFVLRASASGVEVDLRLKLGNLENRVRRLEEELRLARSAQEKLRIQSANKKVAEVTSAVGGIPEEEQLLLGCTASGAVIGLVVGRIFGQVYLGAIAGATAAVFFFSRESHWGNFVRISGKLAVISFYKGLALVQELTMRWKAWRVYERLYKEVESIDKKLSVSSKVGSLNEKFAIADTVSSVLRKVGDAEKSVASSMNPVGEFLSDAVFNISNSIESNYNATAVVWTNLTSTWSDGLRTSLFGTSSNTSPSPPLASSGTEEGGEIITTS